MRTVLFLQGPLSPLYRLIADRLEAAGCRVLRVNLNLGDVLHWRRPGAIAFRGRPAAFGPFLTELIAREGVTDIVLHGDRRIYHRIAGTVARAHGLQVIATELGLLRPDWMLIERDGCALASHFPEDPAAIRAIAARVPPRDRQVRYPGSFFLVAVPDVIYNLVAVAGRPLFPFYRRHTPDHPLLDYGAWIFRLLAEKKRDRAAAALAARLGADIPRWHVLALQLDGDFQIRDNSPFAGMAPVLETVIASFARAAPAGDHLVIKNHPLDNGLTRLGSVAARIAAAHGVAGRVHFVDGGGLKPLLTGASGFVTVNSSAALEALGAGVPVTTLAPALYRVEGLVFTGPLDAFWASAAAPDVSLLEAFLDSVAATLHVRGSIHSRAGLPVAAEGMAARILANDLNEPGAFVDPPPRFAWARRLGIRV
ncbi:capsule biosynthesis protein [Segnochrobactraceae bacterium EtOH-i3]